MKSLNHDSPLAQLTAGKKLPLPKLQVVHLRVIELGLVTAWNRIPPTLRKGALEVDLNASMETQIKNLLQQPGRLRDLAMQVCRGCETLNFDGTSKERRPDLSLTLRYGMYTLHFPLTIECKLLDRLATSKKGVDLYCEKGIKRYVDGEYGWARREGFMVAYVRDGSGISDTLTRYLAKAQNLPHDPYATSVLPLATSVSVHRRDFSYPFVPENQPGPVELHHVWLDAS